MASNFQNKVWFVTGGTGLVGSSIISKLVESEVLIIAMVRKDSDPKKIKWLMDNEIKVFVGDLLDIETFKYQLGTCDVVIHTAAAVRNKDKKYTHRVNYEGTVNIIQAMLEFSIKRIIHISTTGVYGRSSQFPIDEDTVPNPIGEYSKSKWNAELELLKHKKILNITILRPPYIIGDINLDRHVLPTINKLLKRKILPKIWRRDPEFGFAHARDIASITLLTGSLDETPDRIYNIQSFSVSYNELIEFGALINENKIIRIPIPFAIISFSAKFVDFILRLMGHSSILGKRVNLFKHNMVFASDKVTRDLNWIPQYTDNQKIYILLSQLNHPDIETKIDIDIEGIVAETIS